MRQAPDLPSFPRARSAQPSFPWRREPIPLPALDSRRRGNDGCGCLRPQSASRARMEPPSYLGSLGIDKNPQTATMGMSDRRTLPGRERTTSMTWRLALAPFLAAAIVVVAAAGCARDEPADPATPKAPALRRTRRRQQGLSLSRKLRRPPGRRRLRRRRGQPLRRHGPRAFPLPVRSYALGRRAGGGGVSTSNSTTLRT